MQSCLSASFSACDSASEGAEGNASPKRAAPQSGRRRWRFRKGTAGLAQHIRGAQRAFARSSRRQQAWEQAAVGELKSQHSELFHIRAAATRERERERKRER
eukprot:981796-Pleurochrysis_carterae.AAC.2